MLGLVGSAAQREIQVALAQQRDRVVAAELTSLVGIAWLKWLGGGGTVAMLTSVQF